MVVLYICVWFCFYGAQSALVCLDVEELAGVTVMAGSDITDPRVHERVREFLAGRRADVVLRCIVRDHISYTL